MSATYRRALLLTAILVLAPVVALIANDDAKAEAEKHLKEASSFYAEKSYGQALESYTAYLAAIGDDTHAALSEAMLNRAVCFYRLQREDESLTAFDAMTSDKRVHGTMWEARGAYAKAQVRTLLPNWYTRKYDEPEGERAWGRWVQQGNYYDASQENMTDAREQLERASRLARAILDSRDLDENATSWEREFLGQLQLDLAGALEQWDNQNSWESKQFHRTLDDGREYTWNARIPKFEHKGEIYNLYADAERNFRAAADAMLAENQNDATVVTRAQEMTWQGAKSAYRRAVYDLHSAEMNLQYDPDAVEFPGVFEADKDPIPAFRAVIARYPRSRRAPESMYTIAQLYSRMNRFTDSLVVVNELREKYPRSHWVQDANALEQQIKAPRLSLNNGNTTIPVGGKAMVRLTARNIDKVELTVRRLDLVKLFHNNSFLADPDQYFGEWGSINLDLIKNYIGEIVGEQTFETGDSGQHLYYPSKPIDCLLPGAGAYLVTVDGGGLTYTALKVMTDAVIVEKSGPDGTTMWLVERDKSYPIPDAKFTHKEYFEQNNRRWTEVRRSAGDSQGLTFDPRSQTRRNAYSYGTVSMAVAPDGRFAVTDRVSLYYWFQFEGDYLKNCLYTDRPVYRPESTVFFRGMVRRAEDAKYHNLPNARVRYTITNPRGEEIGKGELTTDEFGVYHGSVEVGAKPPLGHYSVNVVLLGGPDRERWLDGMNFQVEEYKKPEYEVTVKSANDFVRLGEDVEADVGVEYYSGGPVAGAKVKVNVFHMQTSHTYRFPRPWDWFFGDWLWRDPDWWGGWWGGSWDGDLIHQIEADADADGKVRVTFPTEAYKPLGGHHKFTIKVEATDESRRVIEGSGAIIVSPTRFSAFVDSRRRVYVENDNIEFEMRTETASGKSVDSEGTLKLMKVKYELGEEEFPGGVHEVLKRTEELIAEMPASTNEEGQGFVQWTIPAGTAGEFVARYHTNDGLMDIAGEFQFWIAGSNYTGEETRFSNFQLIPEKRVYVEGETAKILLTSREKDVHFLYAVESGIDKVKHEVRHTPGSALMLEIPIAKQHVPNFFVDVVAVVKGVPQEQRVELFVPPVDRILDVKVEANAEEYLPGTAGTMNISVFDKDGNPVEASASMQVVDSSVYYIVPDHTPDPRVYFYKYRRQASYNVYTSVYFHSSPRRDDANTYYEWQTHGLPEGTANWWNYQGWMRYDLNWRTQHIGMPNLSFGTTNVMPSESMPQFATQPKPKTVNYPDAGMSNLPKFPNARPSGRAFGGVDDPDSSNENTTTNDPAAGGNWGGSSGEGGVRDELNRLGEDGAADGAPAAPRSAMPGDRSDKADDNFANGRALRQGQQAGPGGAPAGGNVQPAVRKNFADTAAWMPSLRTDANGRLKATVKFPDNLTRWKVQVLVIDKDSRVGYATMTVRTTKNVIVRLQAPRFFTQRDEVVLTAVVQNDLKVGKAVEIACDLPEGILEAIPGVETTVTQDVAAGGRTKVDWRVRVVGTGYATITMSAKTDVESDAQQMTFPVIRYGILKHEVATATIAANQATSEGDATAKLALNVPNEIDPAQSYLRITVEPSVMNVAVQALPYLIEYPYGCIEQTVSRFIPAVMVRRTLQEMGVDLKAIGDFRRNREVKDIPANILAWYKENPVFNELTLDAVIADCMLRIQRAQNSDGGWGWWPGYSSDPYITAYVLHALTIGVRADLPMPAGMLERGGQYLLGQYSKEMNVHTAAFYAFVLADGKYATAEQLNDYVSLIYEKREWLTHTGRAMLCLTQHALDNVDEAQTIARNITGYARVEERNDTAYWDLPGSRSWWFWYHDRNETHAWIMRALNTVDPTNPLLPKLAKFIANSRQGSRWQSTKATAYAVVALVEYARDHGELDAQYTADVLVNGQKVNTIEVTPATVFSLNPDTVLTGDAVPTGPLDIQVVRRGNGAAYITANVAYYTMEDKIPAAAHEAYVKREYTKVETKLIVDEETGAKRTETTRTPIADGDEVQSGDRIEVKLTIEALNDYEYVCIEDPKPAGCEAVAKTSGVMWMGGLVFNREMRDEKVVFFITWLSQGKITLTYDVRAEIPGKFHALPTQVWAMYAPDVHANAESFVMNIKDRD